VVVGNRAPTRAQLSRQQVLTAALSYVDEHGLEALSMHKLGADLGVRAMSLYAHVASKDDLLDGIVDLLWSEVPIGPSSPDWRTAVRELARALRGLVRRHPNAAPLLANRQIVQERSLRVWHALLSVMREGEVPDRCAVPMLHLVFSYGIGYAMAELSYPPPDTDDIDDDVARIRRITAMVSPDASNDLVRTALLVSSGRDMGTEFDVGIDLMIRGLEGCMVDEHADTSDLSADTSSTTAVSRSGRPSRARTRGKDARP